MVSGGGDAETAFLKDDSSRSSLKEVSKTGVQLSAGPPNRLTSEIAIQR